MPVVRPGDAVFHLGLAPKTIVLNRLADEQSPSDERVIRRVRRQLATNIVVSKPE